MSTVKQKCKRIKNYTSANFYRAINSLRVDGIIKTVDEKSAAAGPKLISAVALTGLEPSNARQTKIVDVLQSQGGQMLVRDLLTAAGTTHASIKKLVNTGILESFDVEDVRDPLAHLTNNRKPKKSSFTLTDEQSAAFDTLSKALNECLDQPPSTRANDEQIGASTENIRVITHDQSEQSTPSFQPWLLHGVTGSGKTEIYLRLIEETLKKQRTAILLVPEISLTPQSARRLTERFGTNVAIWHSALSAGEKYDTWRKLRMGEVKISARRSIGNFDGDA